MDDIAAVPLVGDHPVLDLVNTAERDPAAPWTVVDDALRSPADLVTWAVRTGVLTSEEADAATATASSLGAVRAYREAVALVLLALVGALDWPDPRVDRALGAVDRARVQAFEHVRLRPPAPGDRRLADSVETPGGELVIDRLALAATDLLTGDHAVLVKRCPVDDGGCGWLFLDRTKNHSRRWCRMADCGTAVKSRRLTERRRERRRATGDEVG